MHKTVTVRLPEPLYETARALARRRAMSMNALVQQGLKAIATQEAEARLYDAFGLLGEDAAAAGVGFAFEAQREVLVRERRASKSKSIANTSRFASLPH